ncbi:Phage P2 GpU [compost metagenome]
MALMTLGLFVFDLPTLAYQQLQRRTTWRHATSERVGARAAGQFVGPGDDDITLTGMLAPIAFGDPGSLDDLRAMGDAGEAWPLVDGVGRVYGAFVITGLDETQRSIMDNGVARISGFTLSLKRMDDDLPEDEAT